MRAGIIAAGDGSRLVAGGIATPKPLVQVAGQSLLERTLRRLVAGGVSEVALIVNERMAEVAEAAQRLSAPLGVPVRTVIRTTASSMHSLYHLRSHLEGERFVLCTVDTVTRPGELEGFVRAFAGSPADVLLACTDFIDDEKPLYLSVASDGRVTALGQGAEGSPLVTAGQYGLSPAIFEILEEAVASGMARLRNFLGLLLQRGLDVRALRVGKAVDVDRPEDLREAERLLLGDEDHR